MSATIDAWRESLQNPFALACVLSAQINAADARRKEQEQRAAATRSAEVESKAFEDAKARGPLAGRMQWGRAAAGMETVGPPSNSKCDSVKG